MEAGLLTAVNRGMAMPLHVFFFLLSLMETSLQFILWDTVYSHI
jgi:hypothetical protein